MQNYFHKNFLLSRFLLLIFVFFGVILFFEVFVPTYDWVAGNKIGGKDVPFTNQNEVISQTFIASKNNLSGIQIFIRKKGENYPDNQTLSWELVNVTKNQTIVSGFVPIISLEDGGYSTINFKPISDSKFQLFDLKFETNEKIEELFFSSSNIPQSKSLTYKINNIEQPGTLVFNTGYSGEKFSFKLLSIAFGISIFIWIILLGRRKWWNYLQRQCISKLVPIIVSLCGFIFLVIMPPLHMFDEPEHFRRAWDVSVGNFRPSVHDEIVSTQLPEYIQITFDRIYRSVGGTSQNPVQLFEMLFESPHNPRKLSSTISFSSSYSFFAYLLPALFLKVGASIGVSALGLLYLARLANLIQYVVLVAWALKNSKIGKYTIATMAMLGIFVTQGTAISVDSLLLGGSLLFIATVANIAYNKNIELSEKSKIFGLIVGSFCILISKHVYLPLLGLILIIPKEKFTSKKRYYYFILSFIIISGLFAILLQSLNVQGNDPRIDYSKIDIENQLLYILQSPFTWLRIFFSTFISNGFNYYNQFNLINGTNISLGIFGLVQIAAIFFFSWWEAEDLYGKISKSNHFFIIIIIFTSLMFIMLPLYLFWTPVGSTTINGIQGRYFAPLLILVLLVFKPNLIYKGKINPAIFVSIMTFLLVNQIWASIILFY